MKCVCIQRNNLYTKYTYTESTSTSGYGGHNSNCKLKILIDTRTLGINCFTRLKNMELQEVKAVSSTSTNL